MLQQDSGASRVVPAAWGLHWGEVGLTPCQWEWGGAGDLEGSPGPGDLVNRQLFCPSVLTCSTSDRCAGRVTPRQSYRRASE